MHTTRRAALAAALSLPGLARAADWPQRPVRIVVPFPPGGPVDTVTRLIAPRLEAAWGKPVIVDNRGGGGGNVGTAFVARAAPDGYTLLLNASSHAINPSVMANLPYDPLADFAPIALLVSSPLVVAVHPSCPARNLAELVALAKARPGGLNYASAGIGTGNHLAGELLNQMAGIEMVHVPFPGAAPATTAVLAGQVPVILNNMVSTMPHLPDRRLFALAVTGPQRSRFLPEVPAVAESYPGYDATTWYGLLAPAGTPAEIVAEAHRAATAAIVTPEVVARLESQGVDATPLDPGGFTAFLRAEVAKWARVARVSNAQAN